MVFLCLSVMGPPLELLRCPCLPFAAAACRIEVVQTEVKQRVNRAIISNGKFRHHHGEPGLAAGRPAAAGRLRVHRRPGEAPLQDRTFRREIENLPNKVTNNKSRGDGLTWAWRAYWRCPGRPAGTPATGAPCAVPPPPPPPGSGASSSCSWTLKCRTVRNHSILEQVSRRPFKCLAVERGAAYPY